MSEFSKEIIEFNPTKAALLEVKEKYSGLEIKGIDDVAGYALVDEARKDLKRKRREIEVEGKRLRDKATAFSRSVIAQEDELVEIIKPLEKELEAKQDAIDRAKLLKEREAKMPERLEKVDALGIAYSPDNILAMDDNEFARWFIDEKDKVIAEKERLLKEETAKLEEEKRLAAEKEAGRIKDAQEAEALRLAADTKAKEEREAEEKRVAAEHEKEIAEVKRKAEEEKASIIAENKRKEEARIEAEAQKERDRVAAEQNAAAEAKAAKDAEDAEDARQASSAAYEAFLAANGYVDDGSFVVVRKDGKVQLFKKVAEYTPEQI